MFLRIQIMLLLLVIPLAILVGCASSGKGPAYGQEREFRRQLAESVPAKEYGYTIKDLMFSEDYQKALVIFTHPNQELRLSRNMGDRRPDLEFILDSNGFRRYKGSTMQPFYTPGTGNTPGLEITVILPEK